MIDIEAYKLEHAMVVEAMGSDEYWKDALPKIIKRERDKVDLADAQKATLKAAGIAMGKSSDQYLIDVMTGKK